MVEIYWKKITTSDTNLVVLDIVILPLIFTCYFPQTMTMLFIEPNHLMDPLFITSPIEAKPTGSFWELLGLYTSKWRKIQKFSVKFSAFKESQTLLEKFINIPYIVI